MEMVAGEELVSLASYLTTFKCPECSKRRTLVTAVPYQHVGYSEENKVKEES
jgi:hypothetical protein